MIFSVAKRLIVVCAVFLCAEKSLAQDVNNTVQINDSQWKDRAGVGRVFRVELFGITTSTGIVNVEVFRKVYNDTFKSVDPGVGVRRRLTPFGFWIYDWAADQIKLVPGDQIKFKTKLTYTNENGVNITLWSNETPSLTIPKDGGSEKPSED